MMPKPSRARPRWKVENSYTLAPLLCPARDADAQVHVYLARQRKQAQTQPDQGLEIRALHGDVFGLGPDCHRRDERIGLQRAFAAGGIEQLDRQLGGVLTDRQNTSFEECAPQAGLVSASGTERNSYQTGP